MCTLSHPSPEINRLYEQFSRRLQEIVRGAVSAQEAVVEDACQSAWARLMRRGDRVRPETVESWLAITAMREALRLSAREVREPALDLDQPEGAPGLPLQPGPEELFAHRERLDLVRALSRRQQRLVWLRALGLSYEEIAAREKCTNRAVERQLVRARHRLRMVEGGDEPVMVEGATRARPSSGPGRACAAGAPPG